MIFSKQYLNQAGSTLVEVLVAIGLVGIMMPALATALISSSNARPNLTQKVGATGLLNQLNEATRSIRNESWSNIETDGTYHPVVSGTKWILASGPITSNGYTSSVVISDVDRDNSGDIVNTGGTLDPSTKLVTATVSWTTPHASSVSSTIYLTRWQNENQWTQTTAADFSSDTLSNTTVTNVSGGEVELSAGQTSGTLTSQTFDAGSEAGFNYLGFSTSIPTGTNIQIQIATNNDNSTWNYVGPDGTSGSYYTSPGAIPLSAVSGRYLRYQATFTTTNSNIPILDDITLSYSK